MSIGAVLISVLGWRDADLALRCIGGYSSLPVLARFLTPLT